MKIKSLLLIGLFVSTMAMAQQPFEKFGYKVKVSTLSRGKYVEDFTSDSLVQVGSVMINRVTGKIASFITYDTVYSEATLDPQLISRWMSVDPLAEEFYNLSPYNFVENNPINMIDPDGRSGEAVIDKDKKTITVSSHMYYYGSKATDEIAKNSSTEIQNMWNAAGGMVEIDGVEYSVQFNITYEVVSEDAAAELADGNTNIENNFIRIEDTNVLGRSFMEDIGSNSGHWVTSDKLGTSTTAAHEMGHGYGLDHSKEDQRGGGTPDIMAARGTLVDSKYQWNPKAAAGAYGGTLNPTNRQVLQRNIAGTFSGVKFVGGRANIGKVTNTIYKKDGTK